MKVSAYGVVKLTMYRNVRLSLIIHFNVSEGGVREPSPESYIFRIAPHLLHMASLFVAAS